MEFYDVINSRRTVRDFENEEIPEEILEKIIAAAFKAPTNDHMRDWHYIIIRDKEVAASLLDIVPKGISDEDMNQLIRDWKLNDSLQQECYRNAVPKQYRMLFDAAAIIIPLLRQKTDILSFRKDHHRYRQILIPCIQRIAVSPVLKVFRFIKLVPGKHR